MSKHPVFKDLSPHNYPKYEAEQELMRELPHKFLADEIPWNDDDFFPEGGFKDYIQEYRKIYTRYFRQIISSNGFDIDVFPGKAKAAMYVPYLDFETEVDMLMELANHAIEQYNLSGIYKYKYQVSYIEKVNFFLTKHCEFFMTVKVHNLTLRTPKSTFQIHAYKGLDGENIASVCRRKGGMDAKDSDEVTGGDVKTSDEVSGGDVKTSDEVSGGDVKTSDEVSGGDVKTSDEVSGGDVKTSDEVSGGNVTTSDEVSVITEKLADLQT